MEKGLYSFTVVDNNGKSFENVGGTLYLPHNSEFKIIFHNKSDKKADVKFILDGATVGEFRSKENSTIKIERPSNKEKKFTFVSVNSDEGRQGRLDLAPKLGTIEIHVDPEQEYVQKVVRNVVTDSAGAGAFRAFSGFDQTDCVGAVSASLGGTVLGKYSNQRFTIAEYMPTTGQIVKLFANMKVQTGIESLHQ